MNWAPPFLTISRVDMADFVHPHKVIARRSEEWTLIFSSAWNEGESKGEAKY
jgi:hypothetical protein